MRVDNLSKRYVIGERVVQALDGVSLAVERGSFVAVMGASGSGKSTLLHLIGGLDLPDGGSVAIDGHNLTGMNDRSRTLFRRNRIGIVFQAFNLLPSLTAAENVALPLMVAGTPKRIAADKAAELLGRVDLQPRARHRPDALSGGEQQRVAIARALMNDPAVVLADEPTGNLDSRHGLEIWRLLRRFVDEQQRTVLAVTHEAAGAAFADRVVVLKDGRTVGEIESGSQSNASMVAARYQELAG